MTAVMVENILCLLATSTKKKKRGRRRENMWTPNDIGKMPHTRITGKDDPEGFKKFLISQFFCSKLKIFCAFWKILQLKRKKRLGRETTFGQLVSGQSNLPFHREGRK